MLESSPANSPMEALVHVAIDEHYGVCPRDAWKSRFAYLR
jgi:hypothetical protein